MTIFGQSMAHIQSYSQQLLEILIWRPYMIPKMNHIKTVYLLVCHPLQKNLVFVPNLGLSTVLTWNLGVMVRHPPNNEPHLDSLCPIFRAINSTYLKSGSDGPSSSQQWATLNRLMATHKQTKIHQLFLIIFSSYKKKKQ